MESLSVESINIEYERKSNIILLIQIIKNSVPQPSTNTV